MSSGTEQWHAERPRLLSIAYRILGSWHDAEDVVSEAWLRLNRAQQSSEAPRDVPAWLTVVVSRLALDCATSAARQREQYIGPWLPETVVAQEPTSGHLRVSSAEDEAILGEEVDLAFLRLLLTLDPVDRVIVVLAGVGGLTHGEIGEIVGVTPAATRQRLRRSRVRLNVAGGVDPVKVADREVLEKLTASLNRGELSTLVEQLSAGCVLWTDSGGMSKAARNPIVGKDRVARFLRGVIEKYGMPQVSVRKALGGAVLRAISTDLVRMVIIETTAGEITGIQIQQNPSKGQVLLSGVSASG
ncbi:sigma-70 family RNA polymerase sigma factor [Corynebacterium lubricantis]|uniref:sigma-70 family RNA polymerase sigma factor n=1 Tax=Corynebacterium lubricantis TaxID=541095 RepID=UPI000368E775|nr:sigma-70 family RNA polymerase sigma factor [Corynebacterium lubricantis]